MKNPFLNKLPVISLTLLTAVVFSSCSYVRSAAYDSTGELCTTHAFVQQDVPSFVRQRFGSKSQIRTGIIPFSVTANFAGANSEEDFGLYLAKEVQTQLFTSQLLPLVEVAFRPDWPGKRAEFFSGNYGALQLARDAGYDFVMVGMLEPDTGPEKLVISTKLIEAEAGITVWYGKTQVTSLRPDLHKTSSFFGFERRTPSFLPLREMSQEFAKCLVKKISGGDEE